jgi:hypothetical protein
MLVMKLWQPFWVWNLHHCFGPSIFWLSVAALFFSGVLMDFSGDTSNHSSTENSDHMRGRVAAVNSIFVGSSNELLFLKAA